MTVVAVANDIEKFIARWVASSGAERANFQLFASQLCRILGVEEPEPAKENGSLNDYTFERTVEFSHISSTRATGRIDLYKKNCFLMEAKQSREKGRPKALSLPGQLDLLQADYQPRGQRSANRAGDQLMISARRQAEEYARAIARDHAWPPFVLICDVGHCIEVYADFSGQGRNYEQFPDRQGFRIYMQDLRDEKIRKRLRLIWENPADLDPVRQSAKVTREIAGRLAEVSKGLEKRGHKPEEVAFFLMRCLFTMFAEDVGLLPRDSFTTLLARCAGAPSKFGRLVSQLWEAMDTGDFAYAIEQKVWRFNGKLFKDRTALPLEKEEIGELLAAAKYDWKEVEPAIFGTLLEQALDDKERAKLGAHYTPRAYVERLVVVTVIEPLRQEWARVQATAERLKEENRHADAIGAVRNFHHKLCTTRVLDPACGTGNFLYVALELMKRLEGEILEALMDLGGQEALGMDGEAVDPHQFLGLELNPRAAAIAELVIWLGYLQWHFRTKAIVPSEPILRDFRTIKVMDAVLTWEGYPVPSVELSDGKRVLTYPNARRPDWPEADYIVGNPPFIGKGSEQREQLGDEYVEALWSAHSNVNESADYVMYWWDRAAELVANRKAKRFGLVTTNSITQVFNRRVVAYHLGGKHPVSLLMAIPDHPWRKRRKRVAGQSDPNERYAAVRVAMTVGARGSNQGVLRQVVREDGLDTDEPRIEFKLSFGRINADLTVGADASSVTVLRASSGIACNGMMLAGRGFVLSPSEASYFMERDANASATIRPFTNGSDLVRAPSPKFVIDCFGFDEHTLRRTHPHIYQHLLSRVKPERDTNRDSSFKERWWLFGRSRPDHRLAAKQLRRYIGTTETAKHRIFQFLDATVVPDHMIITIATEDAFHLGVLSSCIHVKWALNLGGTLEDRPRYNKSRCFDPFPMPDCDSRFRDQIRVIAEELDQHRKSRQAEHPRLTLTQMYNVLEKLKAGEELTNEDERIKDQGLVLILKELHERLDALVFEAYGWPATLSDEEILERLVALNKERAIEEKTGNVRWLRKDYQVRRFGSDADKAALAEAERKKKAEQDRLAPKQGALSFEDELQEMKPKFPTGEELAETVAVMRVLEAAEAPVSVEEIARHFAQGKVVGKRVGQVVAALARLGHLSATEDGRKVALSGGA